MTRKVWDILVSLEKSTRRTQSSGWQSARLDMGGGRSAFQEATRRRIFGMLGILEN